MLRIQSTPRIISVYTASFRLHFLEKEREEVFEKCSRGNDCKCSSLGCEGKKCMQQQGCSEQELKRSLEYEGEYLYKRWHGGSFSG